MQHYVPQFLLRRFSLDGNIRCLALYNIESRQFIPKASISDQACKSNFYSKENSFEALLAEKESVLSTAVNKLLTEKKVDTKISDSNYELYLLINIQKLRTESQFNDVSTFSKVCLDTLPISAELKNLPIKQYQRMETIKQFNIEVFINNVLSTPILFDLSFRLLENRTNTSFITSDNPVVVFNNYLFNSLGYNLEGLALKGVAIILPLSPMYCLLLKDDSYIACRNSDGISIVTNVEDVNEINSLQVLNRPKNLFFDSSITEEYICSLISLNQQYSIPLNNTIEKRNFDNVNGNTYEDCIATTNVKHRKRPRISFIMTKAILNSSIPLPLKHLVRNPDHCEYVKMKRKELLKKETKTNGTVSLPTESIFVY
ncbi:MAG: DUF4238 domain-containing protein [Candidatus Cloacimonetes bacterium]|nr:DUF4238 domain-containing protein [Candidatus Cloacimonadota bacterium]